MKWQPWEDFRQEEEILPIKEPPCKDCCFWKPSRIYSCNGEYDGVICCTKPDMEHDFSCYREKGEKE